VNQHLLGVRAALAEALHHDGEHARAAESWIDLFASDYRPDESALKAGISLFSLGRDDDGWSWLGRARGAGTAAAEIAYVSGQIHWSRRRYAVALAAFEQATREDHAPARALTALGALHWHLGDKERATRCFREALEMEGEHSEALTNLVNSELDRLSAEAASSLLGRAALAKPSRYQAHALWSRVLRREGRDDDHRTALARARVRRHSLAGVGSTMPAIREPHGQASASGIIGAGEVELLVEYRLPIGDARGLPTRVAVNQGYQDILINGAPARPLPAGPPEALRGLSDAVCELAIPASAWTVDDQLARLRIAVRGRPTGRCVALVRDRVELAGPSAWLPVLLPQRDLHWHVEALDTGLPSHWSTTATDARFLDLLALRGQASTVAVELEWPVSVVGAQPSGPLRHLGFLASKTGRLWQELAGALDAPCPPIVIVDQAASTFCYARAGYIRVPSGILYQAGQQRQLCHEIGHLWWGAGARFAGDAEWLAEALAEYSLHLAEDAGYTPGYRSDVLQRLGEQEPEVADAGLLRLARRTDAEGARTSRAKGGFFISMLRQVMGDDGFRELLRTCHRLGQTHILDAYTFLALASWIHRGSLRWFFNQWVFADTGLSLRLTRAESADQGDRYHLVLQAECHGIATPGTRVDVVVYTSDGAAYRSALDLELGQATLEMTTPGRPERAVLDPDLRWYARRDRAALHVQEQS
jgi:tetratricopeptide (TPR) repeat protein